MQNNPLQALQGYGQSIWLDYIERNMLHNGEMATLIRQDGVSGMTSNPAIFEKAISGSDAYTKDIAVSVAQGKSAVEIYETLAIDDVQSAADLLRDLYDHSNGMDGYVSLEVSPLLAHDTRGSIEEARRLWQRLDRPNVMIKVPATREGIPVVRTLIQDGINVNVTLLFSVGRYVESLDAYMDGLEARYSQGLPVDRVASVASFFLSRIDVMVDKKLDDWMGQDPVRAQVARTLRGQVAIASAAFAYRRFLEHTEGERWRKLEVSGARVQRPLWASTSTKDPAYSDVKYVENLIAPHTVNTLPLETLQAYRDHGQPQERIHEAMRHAPEILRALSAVGIDLGEVDHALEIEGVEKFVTPYRKLLQSIDERSRGVMAT